MNLLATSGKDKLVKLWQLDLENKQINFMKEFKSHSEKSDLAFRLSDEILMFSDGFYI